MTAAEPVSHHQHNPSELPTALHDPVCGMAIDPATAEERAEHAGHTYYFCSSRCRERFDTDPARYLSRAPSVAATAGGDVQWTCPMHPQIVRDQPGSCPICGMALEPMTPVAGEADNPELRGMTRRL